MTLLATGRSEAAFEAPARGGVIEPVRDAAPLLRAVDHRSVPGGTSSLRIVFEEVPGVDRYVLERVWGLGPEALDHIWGSAFDPRDGEIVFRSEPSSLVGARPFTVGFTVRAVFDDGRRGPASRPTFVSAAGGDDPERSHTTERLLLALLIGSSLLLWRLVRIEDSHEHKIRLAAATALTSLMFLSVTAGMPWSSVSDPTGARPAAHCLLGDEPGCATYLPDDGPDPVGTDPSSADRRFELERWSTSATSVRSGLVLTFILMLPALVWLAVAPRVRGAQIATCVGASCAAFTVLAVLFHRLATPSYVTVDSMTAFDVALIASSNIVVAAALIVRSAFALEAPAQPPAARAVRI